MSEITELAEKLKLEGEKFVVAMAGVPHDHVDAYIGKLIERGLQGRRRRAARRPEEGQETGQARCGARDYAGDGGRGYAAACQGAITSSRRSCAASLRVPAIRCRSRHTLMASPCSISPPANSRPPRSTGQPPSRCCSKSCSASSRANTCWPNRCWPTSCLPRG